MIDSWSSLCPMVGCSTTLGQRMWKRDPQGMETYLIKRSSKCLKESSILNANLNYGIQQLLGNVWFQKISIPPSQPRKIIGNSEGWGGGGVHGKLLFQRVTNHKQNIESNVRSVVRTKRYICCFETGHCDEVNIISFNVSVLFLS